MVPPPTIESERLVMRAFTIDDAGAYLPLVSHPDVIRFTGDTPRTTVSEAADILSSHPLKDYELHGYGRMACIEKSTGSLVGFSGLKFLDDMQEIDIGYRFLPGSWGKGYATESAVAVIRDQAVRFSIDRIIGLVEPENMGSVRVLEKLGLHFERSITDADHGALDIYAGQGFSGA